MGAMLSKAERDQAAVEPAPGEGRKYLVFREGPAVLALRIEAVRRVYDAQSGSPPRTPRTRMLDLVELLAVNAGGHEFWIEMEVDDGRYLIPVEQVIGINELSLAVTIDYPPVLKRKENRFIKGLFFDGHRMIADVDDRALAAMTESKFGTAGRAAARVVQPTGAAADLAPAEAEPAGSDRVLRFEAAGRTWAVDLDRVVQVVNREEIHYLPSAGKMVMGAIYYADQAVPVVRPATRDMILAGDADAEEATIRMIVLVETEKGLLGFGADAIVGVAPRNVGPGNDNGERAQTYEIEVKTLLTRLT
jgi:chemotaxis signal transduction protein